MMMKYDDDESMGRRIRGRRSRPDSGAAGEAEGIWRRPRWGRRIAACTVNKSYKTHGAVWVVKCDKRGGPPVSPDSRLSLLHALVDP